MTSRRRKSIVVGYDGTAAARLAVEGAAGELDAGGKLVIVYSAGPAPEVSGAFDLKRVIDRGHKRARAELEALLLEAPAQVVDAEMVLIIDDRSPAKAIIKAAKDHEADLIAIGSRGLGATRTALGSVSNEVLHRAEVAVLVFPERLARADINNPNGSGGSAPAAAS